MNEYIGLIAGQSGDSLVDELKLKGYKVCLICGSNNEPGTNKADNVLVTDLKNNKSIIEFLNKYSVDFVIFGTGHIKAIQLVDELKKSGFITNINYKKSLLAKNKILFKNILRELNINTPNYINFKNEYDLSEIIEKINIPCVIKSATDAVQPKKVNNLKELDYSIKEIQKTNTEVLIEDYINGNDCTVAVKNDLDKIENLGVTYYSKAKEYKLEGFNNAFSIKLSKKMEKEICEIAEKIVLELNFIGLVRVDFIVKNANIYVLELNPVIVTGYKGSSYPFFKRRGINIAKVMVDTSLKIYENKKNN